MTSTSRIRKLVIPAAGLGTRFLPATKVVPKELLPIAGKPLIQFAVEEAAASGIETVILVISRGKGLLAEHFHANPHLENLLRARGNPQAAELIRQLSELAEIRTVWQHSPWGWRTPFVAHERRWEMNHSQQFCPTPSSTPSVPASPSSWPVMRTAPAAWQRRL
jgi:hypothetical protein